MSYTGTLLNRYSSFFSGCAIGSVIPYPLMWNAAGQYRSLVCTVLTVIPVLPVCTMLTMALALVAASLAVLSAAIAVPLALVSDAVDYCADFF